ncbi:MAG: RNA polymerase sigma factor [Bilifractor sp.]|jgi:RNA polymerase sigma-70 factor (ECF subfamily)
MTESSFHFDIDEAVRKYADMVYRLASVNTNRSPEVEDIFQNVFLKLFQHQSSITSEEHLKAWLIRVTINECRSEMTSAWRKRRVSLDSMGEQASEEKEDLSDVTNAVLELPENYREVIHLFYYENLSIKEIAEVLDLTEGAVKTRLRRGRESLKKKLKGAYDL